MKKLLSLLTLAALTVGLLGSCKKINERLDVIDQRVGDIEQEKIASIQNQIAAINASIADLGTIRKDIADLQAAVEAKGEDISELQAADKAIVQRLSELQAADAAIEKRIDELKAVVGDLSRYAEKDWATATFATLEQLNATNSELSALKEIVEGLGGIIDEKIAKVKSSLSASISSAIRGVSASISDLEARVIALEEMIQSVTLVQAYSDGSVKAENGILTIDCIISPKEAVISLKKDNFAVLTNKALTKSVMVDTIKIAKDEDLVIDKTNGTATITVDVSDVLPAEEDKALTVAVNVKNGISDFTTEFVPVTVAGPIPGPEIITGTGTKADPYVLYTAEHLAKVGELAKSVTWSDRSSYFAADSTCFKLGNDIDLKGTDWTPIDLGMDKAKGKKIDFNGAGFTIKNFKIKGGEKVGFFSNLVGNIHDLKVTGAEVTVNDNKGGILVGQASTGDDIYTSIYNCYVQGKVTSPNGFDNDPTGKYEVSIGGVVGQQCFGEIHQCEADVELVMGGTKGHYAGGIIGSFGKDSCPIKDCITRGNYHAADGTKAYRFGGIAGASQKNGFTITNCISLAKISCADFAGGIVGHLNYNKVKQTCHDTAQDCDVVGCIAWNEAITASGPAKLSAIQIGAIVASGSEGDVYANCWRSPSLTGFTDDADHAKNEAFKDMPVIRYNGKAATGKTASAVAKEIGWDETIWDLSGDVPALKCLK